MTRSVSGPILAVLGLAALLLPPAAGARKKPKGNVAVVVGKVVDQRGVSIAGVRITVTAKLASDFQAEATSDSEGAFTLRVTDPKGVYRFRLEGEGYAPLEGEVQLTAGEKVRLAVKLLDPAARRQEAIQAYNAAAESFNQGDFGAARARFLEAVAADPELVEAYLALAHIYHAEHNLEEAAAAVDRYLAAKPGDVAGLDLAYTIYHERGDEARAEELIDALARTAKVKPLAREIYNQGVAATQRGDWARGVERFRRAAELDPELAPAYSSEATALYNLERYDEALAALENLFAVDADSVQGRRVRYLVYDALDDQAKAGEALDAYLAADADGAIDLMYQRADLDFRNGETTRAIALLERIIELRPEMPRAHYTLGLWYISSDKEKAVTHLQTFLQLAPDDPEAAGAKKRLSNLE